MDESDDHPPLNMMIRFAGETCLETIADER